MYAAQLKSPLMADPETELLRQVGARIRLTRRAIWGRDRQACLDEMGISKNQLYRWEIGESEPSTLFITLLNEKHDVTADWIYLGDDRRLPSELLEKINQIKEKIARK